VVIGISDTDWRLGSALVAAAGFVAAARLWWIYFDVINLLDIKRGLLSRNVFIYGHLPVAVGLAAAGVGIKKAILYANEPALSAAGAWALCGGAALFLGAVGLIYAISTRSTHTRNLAAHAVTAIIALCLAGGGAMVAPPVLIGLLLLTLLSLVAFEVIEKSPHETTGDGPSRMPEKSE
jgi:low temperature requirement protein LtrA